MYTIYSLQNHWDTCLPISKGIRRLLAGTFNLCMTDDLLTPPSCQWRRWKLLKEFSHPFCCFSNMPLCLHSTSKYLLSWYNLLCWNHQITPKDFCKISILIQKLLKEFCKKPHNHHSIDKASNLDLQVKSASWSTKQL